MPQLSMQYSTFQSTLSVRRATNMMRLDNTVSVFQSTLSVRRATRRDGGGELRRELFQSTLSVRRATIKIQK